MERRVDDARLHAFGDLRVQRRSRRRGSAARRDRRRGCRGSRRRTDGFPARPPRASGCSRCAASARRRCIATGCGRSSASSGKSGPVRSSVGTYSVSMNWPLPRTKRSTCMIGVPVGRRVVARPLHGAELVELGVGDAAEGRRRRGDLVHDLATGVCNPSAARAPRRVPWWPPNPPCRRAARSPCARG